MEIRKSRVVRAALAAQELQVVAMAVSKRQGFFPPNVFRRKYYDEHNWVVRHPGVLNFKKLTIARRQK
jgi:hypothetical protein